VLRCAGHWTKISALSVLTVSPRRRRVHLYARFHRNKNVRFTEVIQFLRQMLRHVRGPIVLLWDSNQPHRAVAVRVFLQKHSRLHTERFPGYAPELNPDEFVWNHLKRAVANSAPEDLHHLKRLLHPPLQRLRQSQQLLWSCIRGSDLPWP
jgi:transposase